MSDMQTGGQGTIAETLRDLYAITTDLESRYPGRHFTPDGHLIGSIGEVYAAERYGIDLFRADWKAHDGKAPDDRLVQIKATQRSSVGISEKPDFLIVLRIDEHGDIAEVYNGPGKPVWDLFKNRKRPKNGQYQVSLARLSKLNEAVVAEDRIPSIL